MEVKCVVLDTNILVAGLRSAEGAAREAIRICLRGECVPLMSNALFTEIEALFARGELWDESLLSLPERQEFLDGFLSVCQWVPVFYLWRPNLADESDNHVYELALAGGASAIVTYNLRDFQRGEILFPQIHILTPADFLQRIREIQK